MITNIQEQAFINELVADLWLHGRLQYKLKAHQEEFYKAIKEFLNSNTGIKFAIECSRRFGKTFVLFLIVAEIGYSIANQKIRYYAQTRKDAIEIVSPIAEQIFSDLYANRPVWNETKATYNFHNGSIIYLIGCDDIRSIDNQRGKQTDINVIDEAGTNYYLRYLYTSVIAPQILTSPNGKTIISGTPSPDLTHYFYDIAESCKMAGNYIMYTIDDNTSLSTERKKAIIDESGGIDSDTVRREYYCEKVIDASRVIIPEWDTKYVQENERDEYYQFYQVYESMDIGGVHKTVILYSYYDFKNAKLIVEYESVFSGAVTTTKKISEEIDLIETSYYKNKKIKRYADNNAVLMLQTLGIDNHKYFEPTSKTELRGESKFDGSMINTARLFIERGHLQVHPRCKELIGNLNNGMWNERRNLFQESRLYGHYDALAALIYLIRNVDTQTNPIPTLYEIDNPHNYHGLERLEDRSKANQLRKVFT